MQKHDLYTLVQHKEIVSGMNRRMFMKTSMAFAAVSGMSGLSTLFAQSARAEDGIADGTATRFDFEVLKKKAANMAKAWAARPARCQKRWRP